MPNTPIEELESIESDVHQEFGDQVPSVELVTESLEKRYDTTAVVETAALLAFLAFLKANGITLATLSGWIVAGYGKWGGPRCPIDKKKQVAVDPNTGESVCSNGHRWRP